MTSSIFLSRRRMRGRGAPLARARRPGRLRRRLGDQTVAKALQRRSCGLLLSLLLGRPMPGAERVRSREHDGRVLALVADARALAVIERGRPEALLRHLLEAALEVLVLGRGRQ